MPSVTKGYLKINDTGRVEKFQYNPNLLTDSQSFNFSVVSSPCSNYPKFVYTGTSEVAIPLELFLVGNSQIKTWESFIKEFSPKGRFDKPKTLTFAFGSTIRKVVCTSISKEYTEFNNKLQPIQGYITMTLVEVR